MNIETIMELADIFAQHGIYAKNRFESMTCPLRVFKALFPTDAYTKQIDTFLGCQPGYNPGNGADLPWWGNRYFSEDTDIRIMILSQDSRNPDAGSVVFYMPLLKENKSPSELRSVISGHLGWDPFVSFEKVKKFFDKCHFDYDFAYVTDAQKIDDGWQELLEEEIQVVKPDVIVCLGNKGLTYLTMDQEPKVTKLVDENAGRLSISPKVLPLMSNKPVLIASLFPSKGNGHYTDQRENRVVSTYHAVIQELQSLVRENGGNHDDTSASF